jgi:LuxR family maltose regulon positive regulatory protein
VDFGISSTRAKTQKLIHEIRFSQLNFSIEETAELLGEKIARDIGANGIAEIHRRTEGWAAGIRLAQMILGDSVRPPEALEMFSGADQDVSALLNQHVLEMFRPDLKRLLFDLSHLRVFSADQLAFITGDSSAGQKLHELITRNAFVMPIDRNSRVFRLHELFRDCLRKGATAFVGEPDRRRLLSRAAAWCELQGEWQDAVTYSLEASDMANATRLLELAAPALVRDMGKIHFYVRSVDQLLSRQIKIGLEAQYWYIYALIFHRRYATAAQQHERLVSIITQSTADCSLQREEFSQRLDHLRICIAFLTDQLSEAKASADRWLESSSPKETFDIGWIRCIQSICFLTSYKFFEAREALRLAEPFVREVGSPYVTAWCSLVRGTIELYEGNCAEAYRIITTSRDKAGKALGYDSNICDTMASIGAECAVEMGLMEEARELLKHMLPSAGWHGTVGSAACGMNAAISLWDGHNDDAIDLEELQDIARSYPPRLALMMSCYMIRRLIVLDRLREAVAEAEKLGLNIETGRLRDHREQIPRVRELLAATSINILVALGRDAEASERIDEEMQLARANRRMGRQVELHLARMEMDHRGGRIDCARHNLIKAIRQAAALRLVRPFVERIGILASIVNGQALVPELFATREERDFFRVICERFPAAEPETRAQAGLGKANAFEMPTRRELELLTMVGMGLSNQEIAAHTDTSVTTIKWHLKNVFRKFNVTNRTSAVARAHSFGLLSR